MKEAKIIILSGQSNAVGVGHMACLPKHCTVEKIAEYRLGYDRVKINYLSHDKKSEGFVNTAANCAEFTKDTFGPEVGMAEYICEKDPESAYFIVKCAIGGKSLCYDFRSPSSGAPYTAGAYATQWSHSGYSNPIEGGWAYNELVKLTKESIEALEQEGYTPRILGFCWMQGENEACDRAAAEGYGRIYANFIADLTAAFAPYMEGCKFVDGGISRQWSFYETVNLQKKAYAEAHENCVYLDTIAAGLTTANEPEEAPDLAHYDSDSTLKLGRMFAEAVLG